MITAILDAQNLWQRSRHGGISAPMTRSDDQQVGAVILFAVTLDIILRRNGVTHLAGVFDGPGKGFRRALHDSYKGMRESGASDPGELWQLAAVKHLIRAVGGAVIHSAPLEADDVIVGMCERTRGATLVCTDDKDMQFLAHERRVRIFRFYDNDVLTGTLVQERWGCRAERIPEVQALCGDGGDGVPGLPGIGKKTACAVVARYGNAERALCAVPAWAGKNWIAQASAVQQSRYAMQAVRALRDPRATHRAHPLRRDWAHRLLSVLGSMESVRHLTQVCKKHGIAPSRVHADPALSADRQRTGADPLPVDAFD